MAAEGVALTLLVDLVVILGVAKLFAEIAERLGQPPVLGELLGGVIIGPGALAFLPHLLGAAEPGPREATLLFLAELGAILLLFEVGLETDLGQMLRVGRAATVVAVIGIVASVAFGYAVSWGLARSGWVPSWPDSRIFHLFMGATFAATSVGITARVLKDLGRLGTDDARIILGAAVADDVGGLLVLAFVVALASTGTFDAFALGLTLLKALAFLAIAVTVGAWLAPRVFPHVARLRVRGGVVVVAVALGLAFAWAAAQVHLAPIVGAFAAGMVVGRAREHREVLAGVGALGTILIPIFFVVMGAAVDVRAIAADAGLVLGLTAVLLVAATAAKLLCGLGVRRGEADRWVVGVGMVPRGEVGLIFVATGIALLDLLPYQIATLVLTVMLTTVVTPPWLRALFAKRPAPPAAPPSEEMEDKAAIGDR